MKRNAFALLLLSTFLLGWMAGPSPCHPGRAGEAMSGHSSCHGSAGTTEAGAKNTLSLRAQDCCGIACQHACHLVAVLSVEPATPIVAPLSQRPIVEADRDVPPVAFGIDHIPLA